MSLVGAARHSFFWSFFDKWISRALQMSIFLVLGRLLAPDDFGVVAMATAYVQLVNLIVDAGFSRALIQKKNIVKSDIATAMLINICIGIAISAFTYFTSGTIATILGMPLLHGVLDVMTVAILLQSISAVPAAMLERAMKYKPLAIRRTVGATLGGVVAVILAFAGWGVWSLVAQTVVAAAVGTILLWFSYRSWPGLRFSQDSFNSLRSTGINVFGMELIGYGNSQADRVVIGIFLGPEALGYYYMAMRLVSIVNELFTAVISAVALPIFSRLQEEPERLRSWLRRLTTTTATVTVPVFALIGVVPDFILGILVGSQWTPSADILRILVFLGMINSMLLFDRQALIAVGRASTAMRLTLGQAIIGLVLVLIAGPFGIVAVAFAVVARQFVFWPVRLVALRKWVGIKIWPYLRGFTVAFAAALLSVAGAWTLTAIASPLQGFALIAAQGGLCVLVFVALYACFCRTAIKDVLGAIGQRSL